MNTTFDNEKAKTMIDIQFNPAQAEADALSLAEFNRLHGDQVRRAAESARKHKKVMAINKAFDLGMVVLIVTTAVASAYGLLTMIAQ